MKKSNRLLTLIAIVLLGGIWATDRLLAKAYTAIDLGDPYKNYQDVTVPSFAALQITGGNGYAIQIGYGKSCNVKVMNSRKSFLKMTTKGDTLFINFAVAKIHHQGAKKLPVGLLITCPDISYIKLSGTYNLLEALRADSLLLVQDANSVTISNRMNVRDLFLRAGQTSWFDFNQHNAVEKLKIHATGDAGINLQGILFQQFDPSLGDQGKIVFFKQSLEKINLIRGDQKGQSK